MRKDRFCTILALVLAVFCMVSFTACGEDSKSPSDDTPHTKKTDKPWPSVSETEDPSGSTADPAEKPQSGDNGIAKIQVAAEEDGSGIYAVVITLKDKAADKGVIEMVYHGVPGTPQENSVVDTFRIEYYKDDTGLFEISTFDNGEVYQNQHRKDTVKVVNEFGASVRAGDVIITYTPDGGTPEEIYRTTAAEVLSKISK